MSSEVISSSQFLNYFESLYNNSRLNAVIIMDTDGNILTVNAAFTNSFGYTTSELKGKNFEILFTKEDRQNDRPKREVETAIATGQCDDRNFLVKKNKDAVWVSGETLRIGNVNGTGYLLKVIQDISGQKEAEHTVSRALDFNESILNSIDDIVIVLDNELQVIKANPAFYSLFKRVNPEKLSSDFVHFISPFDKKGDLIRQLRKLVDTGEAFTDFELEVATLNGDRIFTITGRPMHTPQNQEGILLVIHEITIQKQSEREREDIIGFVAHELRNPLSNVILCNEMLRHIINTEEPGKSEAGQLLQRSQNNVFRLNKMIGELYEATKMNSGHFILEITEFDFDEMVKEAIDTVQVLQPAFKIVTEGSAGRVKGDRYRLIQVVTNYLSNGIKYSNGNTDVRIRTSVKEDMVVMAVQDKGLGIPASQLPYIFDRFFRAEKTKNLEGIGLGLFLCRRIIDAHHGKVWAESEEGKGSVFYFSIPALLN